MYDKLPLDQVKIKLLIDIANELAEANRLKRLEIKQNVNMGVQNAELQWISKGGTWTGVKGVEGFFNELEDKV